MWSILSDIRACWITNSLLMRTRDLLPRRSTVSGMTSANGNEIFLDEEEVNLSKEGLIELVIDYIKIGKDTGRIVLNADFDGLNNTQKILVILFAEKLRSNHMGIYDGDEYLSPNKISELSETKIEVLYPSIRKLEQRGLLSYDSETGRYCINPEPEKITEARRIVADAGKK